MPTKFWIVLANQHELRASYRHETKESAITEAHRLSSVNGNVSFLVAEIIGEVRRQTPPTEFIEATSDDAYGEFSPDVLEDDA